MWRLSGTILLYKSWLEMFRSVPRRHKPLCNPCHKPAFPAFSFPQILLPLFPEVSSPQFSWQSVIPDPTPPHTSAALPHPLLWLLEMRSPSPLTPSPLCFLLSPKLLLSWTTTSNNLSCLGFLPPVTQLCELLSSSCLPHAHPSPALQVLAGWSQNLCYLLLHLWSACSPISTTVAEHSPWFGSVPRNRL